MTSGLHTLAGQLQDQRDQLLAGLRRAADRLQALRFQHEQLVAYRGDYRLRWQARSGQATTMQTVHLTADFMQRLEGALDSAKGPMVAAEATVERLRAEALAVDLRLAAVKKLIERRGLEHARLAQRHEQRRSDETALQAHLRSLPTTPATL